jgi:hypothetical protein
MSLMCFGRKPSKSPAEPAGKDLQAAAMRLCLIPVAAACRNLASSFAVYCGGYTARGRLLHGKIIHSAVIAVINVKNLPV